MIHRCLRIALIALLLSGSMAVFAEDPATSEELTKEERLELILTETLPESEYREMSRCLWRHAYRDVEVLNDRYLLFRGRKDQVWINRLRHRCSGLRKNQILVFRQFGSSLCETDRVTGSDRGFGESANCMLGQFQKIDEQRADALKEAFRKAGRS